jgi:hypothetical protein
MILQGVSASEWVCSDTSVRASRTASHPRSAVSLPGLADLSRSWDRKVRGLLPAVRTFDVMRGTDEKSGNGICSSG